MSSTSKVRIASRRSRGRAVCRSGRGRRRRTRGRARTAAAEGAALHAGDGERRPPQERVAIS
ncbi:Os02g0821100 [Oryza sativa Japonica Group]|uniref:Os02g0821100 protein n=1 Tax=Oryza sativa subsp. japonica TaxID=39947 RepID=Q6K706_ORYSJ|nr:unknown protein [Oryza sativa Japonica Group]BAD23113.1 unknown protein [Oryza sativa Japonica Group]BAF10462.1 Os02g0821100 [Oryza sativa Japonica Group]|eukprot:NP_001048548.1 Os02g0821100 [Oryza sativa Japonica Group]